MITGMATQTFEDGVPRDTLPMRLYIARFNGQRVVSQREAAKAIGVSHTTWGEWERGTYSPRHSQLRAIADYLGVSFRWLMEGGSLVGPTPGTTGDLGQTADRATPNGPRDLRYATTPVSPVGLTDSVPSSPIRTIRRVA